MGKTVEFIEIEDISTEHRLPADTLEWFRTGSPVDRKGPTISDEETAALARAVTNLFKRWELSDAESCVLLGGMSRTPWGFPPNRRRCVPF